MLKTQTNLQVKIVVGGQINLPEVVEGQLQK
jgi:hypothetical protein